jgi:hypothetical protein
LPSKFFPKIPVEFTMTQINKTENSNMFLREIPQIPAKKTFVATLKRRFFVFPYTIPQVQGSLRRKQRQRNEENSGRKIDKIPKGCDCILRKSLRDIEAVVITIN